jgi:hypothetical protein
VIGALIAGALALSATDPTLTASELFIYPLPLVAMLAAVVGILMFTGEGPNTAPWRSRLRPNLLAG